MTNTEQNRENQTYGQHGLHQKLVVNPDTRAGYAVPASYKTQTMLFIYIVKFDKGIVGVRGKTKKIHKKQKIHCHLRYGYFVTMTV